MSIIIRLQNLPLEANSLDIRRFFQGLHIPDGGVHIVGGENGDAFIAFGGDEDARQAMERNGNTIKGARIKLLLSSRNEMQRVIDNARTQTIGITPKPSISGPPPGPTQAPGLGGQFSAGQYQSPPQASSLTKPQPVSVNSPFGYGQSQGMSSYGKPMMAGGDAYGQRAPPEPFRRSRSRSRSPPLPRRVDQTPLIKNESEHQHPMGSGAMTNMHTGLMGSLQQPPPSNHNFGPPPTQNGSAFPPTSVNQNFNNNHGSMAPTQRDQGYYSKFDPPYQQGPPELPKFDNRWNTNQSQGLLPTSSAPMNQLPPSNNYNNRPMPPQDMYRKPMDQMPVVNNGGGPSSSYGAQMNQYPQNEPIIQHQQPPPIQSQPSRMFTLQLWNLSLHVKTPDLIEFFQPLYLTEDNIKLCFDEKGFPTGMAMVRFPTVREAETAMTYSGKFLYDRHISIRPLDDLSNTSNQMNHVSSAPPPVVNQMTQSSNIVNSGPMQQMPPPQQAMPVQDYANYRNTQLPPSPPEMYPPRTAQPAPMPPPAQYVQAPSEPVHQTPAPNKDLVAYMKGLPYISCTPKDVAMFFEPIRLANIEIETDNRGKPTGNAYVEFHDKRDFEHGMTYNMRHMGPRYIELIPLWKLEKSRFGPPPPSSAPEAPRTFCISVRGLGPNVTSQELKSYFADVGARTYAVHISLRPDKMAAGEAFLEFSTKEFQLRALKQDGAFLGPDRITVRPVPYEVVMQSVKGGPPHGPPVGPPPGPGGPHSADPSIYRDGSKGARMDRFRPEKEIRAPRGGNGLSGGRGPPRNGPPPFLDKDCILTAMNLSPKASDDDLCVFFSDYHITPGRVKRRPNDQDSTLEAQISFYSRVDAEHALRNMDKKYFLGRSIHLQFA